MGTSPDRRIPGAAAQLRPGIATPREWGWAQKPAHTSLFIGPSVLELLRPVNGDGHGAVGGQIGMTRESLGSLRPVDGDGHKTAFVAGSRSLSTLESLRPVNGDGQGKL